MVLQYIQNPEKFVGRQAWDAVPPEGKIRPLKLPVNNVFVTFTETDQCAQSAKDLLSCGELVREIQQRAIWEHDMPDIPYNFLIGGDGMIYEGRGWRQRPEDIPNHPELNENGDTLVLAYIGRKNDKVPKYRMKVLLDMEATLNDFGTSRRFIKSGANNVMGPAWDMDEHFTETEEEDEEDDLEGAEVEDMENFDVDKWLNENYKYKLDKKGDEGGEVEDEND